MEPQRNLQGIGRKETRNFHQRRDIAKGLGLRSLLEADVHRCWPPVTPQEMLKVSGVTLRRRRGKRKVKIIIKKHLSGYNVAGVWSR